MARRKSRRGTRLRTALLLIALPVVVWSLAFVVWLYWNDIVRNFTPGKEQTKAAAKPNGGPASRADRQAPTEEIRDEERKELDAIIRKENR